MSKNLFLPLCLLVVLLPSFLYAQILVADQHTVVKARVIDVESEATETVAGSDTQTTLQKLKVEILEGTEKGQMIEFTNDYTPLSAGELFYLTKNVDGQSGITIYSVSDPYRLNSLWIFIGLFVLLVAVFGGKQGIRGLVSLGISLALIVFVLLPGILHGYSPILISIGVASFIIIFGSYITHGFNKTTTSAVMGMILTVMMTGLLAHIAIGSSHLNGFGSEESVYLNFNTRGHLDFVGLLLGGMIIGLLGVLYDAAISQAIAVEELHHIAPHLPRWTIYKRAIRIGKEHIGALVNTLAIAYVGVALPTLLLFSTSTGVSFAQIVNRENFATEIIRTMVGSIGLVLAVPVTTLLAVLILIRTDVHITEEEKRKELYRLEEYHHTH